jgi:hypothetical protein
MDIRRIIATLGLMMSLWTVLRAQELAVWFHPEKSTNPLGEPIFVSVEFTNISPQTVRFDDGPCAQSFTPGHRVPGHGNSSLYGCSGGGVVSSCLGSFVDLKSGEKLSRRYLLPDGLEPDAPGEFDYQTKRQITFYATGGPTGYWTGRK